MRDMEQSNTWPENWKYRCHVLTDEILIWNQSSRQPSGTDCYGPVVTMLSKHQCGVACCSDWGETQVCQSPQRPPTSHRQCTVNDHCQQCHPASPINHHLTLKHRETHGCVVSTAAKAPGHQYPQCWLNIHCIGPVSYKNTTLMLDNITRVENQITFWRNKRTESSKSTWPQCSFYNTHDR